MNELLFCLVVAFAFFAQSLMGFGGGLIAIPLLGLVMPLQEVVTVIILYQFSMGLLLFKIYKQVSWREIWRMTPAMVIGTVLGLLVLKYVPGDAIRIFLALYIILHLLRTHTAFDPLKKILEWGGTHLAGFLGGGIQGTLGTGGPAFILYLKDIAKNSGEFRANVTAIMFLSHIPRIIGSSEFGWITPDLMKLGLIAYPGFLAALALGQMLHDKIPQKIFFMIVEAILVFSVLSLVLKVVL